MVGYHACAIARKTIIAHGEKKRPSRELWMTQAQLGKHNGNGLCHLRGSFPHGNGFVGSCFGCLDLWGFEDMGPHITPNSNKCVLMKRVWNPIL